LQASAFDQILTDETRELRAFLSLLEREREALDSTDAEPLMAICVEKSQASDRLHASGLRRTAWFANQGKGTGPEAVSAWLASLPSHAPQRRAWQQLMDLARRARKLNEECGALIRTRMQHGQQALAVLLAASDRAALYGPNGHALGAPAKRHLGSI
jgi:flagellar biosynthesis/type III secretory pathway chaperone